MGRENEIIILDVDRGETVKRLRELKAKPLGRYRFRRMEFLLKGDVRGGHSWGRVRTDGKETTITVKEMTGRGGYNSMDEHEIKTDDFESAVRLMSKLINSELVVYFENERESYRLGKAHITIDKWPEIPVFVEIEAPSMHIVKGTYKRLKINGRFAGNLPIHKIYGLYDLNFRDVMRKNGPKLKKLIGGRKLVGALAKRHG